MSEPNMFEEGMGVDNDVTDILSSSGKEKLRDIENPKKEDAVASLPPLNSRAILDIRREVVLQLISAGTSGDVLSEADKLVNFIVSGPQGAPDGPEDGPEGDPGHWGSPGT